MSMEREAQKIDMKARRAVRDVKEQAGDASESLQAVAQTFYSAVEKSVRDQPLTTLGFAVVMGAILGALWKA